jgi:hypothetical protein
LREFTDNFSFAALLLVLQNNIGLKIRVGLDIENYIFYAIFVQVTATVATDIITRVPFPGANDTYYR